MCLNPGKVKSLVLLVVEWLWRAPQCSQLLSIKNFLAINLHRVCPPVTACSHLVAEQNVAWGYLLELICLGCICTFVYLFTIWAVTFIGTNVLRKASSRRNVNICSEKQPDPDSKTYLLTLSTWMCLIDFVEWNLMLGAEAMPWAFTRQLRQIGRCPDWAKIVQDLSSLYWIWRDKTHARDLHTFGKT